MLYNAAETVRVRTVLEFRLHHPTCIGWGVGYDSRTVTRANRAHLEELSGSTDIAITHGRNQI